MPVELRRLAALLYEEFERDQWGDVDPYLFAMVADGRIDGVDADGEPLDEDLADGARGVHEVLARVCARLEM